MNEILKGDVKKRGPNMNQSECVHGMIITYMHRTDKYSQHGSIIWPVWVNG